MRLSTAWLLAVIAAVSVAVFTGALFVGHQLSARRVRASVRGTAGVAGGPARVEVERLPEPTPIFASYRSVMLFLPVNPSAVTAIAFHQAAKDNALHMTSLVRRPATVSAAASASADDTDPSAAEVEAAEGPRPRTYTGRVLRLWRSGRRGLPDSAADVGAAPGTVVYSPVSGTVTAVRPYRLYGQWEDFEVHIRPDRAFDLDVVMIHLDRVRVRPGDSVIGGESSIAEVRWLSKNVMLQLADYTGDGGNHVHVQVNKAQPKAEPVPVGES